MQDNTRKQQPCVNSFFQFWRLRGNFNEAQRRDLLETSGFKKVGAWSPYLTLEVTHKVIIGL